MPNTAIHCLGAVASSKIINRTMLRVPFCLKGNGGRINFNERSDFLNHQTNSPQSYTCLASFYVYVRIHESGMS